MLNVVVIHRHTEFCCSFRNTAAIAKAKDYYCVRATFGDAGYIPCVGGGESLTRGSDPVPVPPDPRLQVRACAEVRRCLGFVMLGMSTSISPF